MKRKSMDRIKVGDLVIVAQPPLCPWAKPNAHVGRIFTVKAIRTLSNGCGYCGAAHLPRVRCASDGELWIPLYRLKRIEPLGTETTEQTVEMLETVA